MLQRLGNADDADYIAAPEWPGVVQAAAAALATMVRASATTAGPPTFVDGRAWTNYVVTQTAAAAAGLVGDGIMALGVVTRGEEVELHFGVPTMSVDVRTDIEEIVGELDVLLEGRTPIRAIIDDGVSCLDRRQIEPVFGRRMFAWEDESSS